MKLCFTFLTVRHNDDPAAATEQLRNFAVLLLHFSTFRYLYAVHLIVA